jgi:hypothetical protein
MYVFAHVCGTVSRLKLFVVNWILRMQGSDNSWVVCVVVRAYVPRIHHIVLALFLHSKSQVLQIHEGLELFPCLTGFL